MIRLVLLGDYRTCRDWLRSRDISDHDAVVISRATLEAGVRRLVGLVGPVEVIRLHDYPSWSPREHAIVERRVRIVNATQAGRDVVPER